MNTTNDRIIIGIDPGTNVMGYGVLRIVGNTPELMTLGVIQLNKFESHYLRLRRIFERVLGLIEQYLPDEIAGEKFYVPCENGHERKIKEWMQYIRQNQ